MDLNLELLDNLEAPLSAEFWGGFAVGMGIVLLGVGIVTIT